MAAISLETYALTKRFGVFTALDQVSLKAQPGTVHALLGENGAGKSTIVKCIAGFYRADDGAVLLDGREREIRNPVMARQHGIGMVYQHFTLAPGMTVAENLLLAAGTRSTLIDWGQRRKELQAFMERTPFRLPLDARPMELAAGEKQKLELLKQLYLEPGLLILDEPTSVLTPQEADEVLGHIRQLARSGQCTVLLITHKFREVAAYADEVTVLRRGRQVYRGSAAQATPEILTQAMVGEAANVAGKDCNPSTRSGGGSDRAARPLALQVHGLTVLGDRGTESVRNLSLQVASGEILGIAGVSGNGQRELFEAIVGQRARQRGSVDVRGEPYWATRQENHRLKVRSLPEEPLKNACVPSMSVADNMALRDFDLAPLVSGGVLRPTPWRDRARAWIADYGVKTQGEDAAIASLSGGNIQRAVLARELAGEVDVLVAANPAFGLDFAAVRQIHGRIRSVRDRGGAVLLISEDLDELLELADRIVVMSEGRTVFETPAAGASRAEIGLHMAGGHVSAAS